MNAARYAILGDIHSNWPALEAVLADAGQQGVTAYACVGDIVGYNAQPAPCLEKIRAMNCAAVMGNHEFNAIAWFLPDPERPGEYLRKHHSAKYGDKNRRQHQAFLSAVEGTLRHEEWVSWFLSLPLFLDLPLTLPYLFA